MVRTLSRKRQLPQKMYCKVYREMGVTVIKAFAFVSSFEMKKITFCKSWKLIALKYRNRLM